jgi:hypothetical protein
LRALFSDSKICICFCILWSVAIMVSGANKPLIWCYQQPILLITSLLRTYPVWLLAVNLGVKFPANRIFAITPFALRRSTDSCTSCTSSFHCLETSEPKPCRAINPNRMWPTTTLQQLTPSMWIARDGNMYIRVRSTTNPLKESK